MSNKPRFVGVGSRVKLGDIAEVTAGNVAPKKDSFSDEGTPFVRAGSLSALLAGASISDLEKVPDEEASRLKLKLFPEGTVLFAKSGMSCMTGNVYVLPQPCYVVSHLACVTAKGDWALYLKHYFRFNKPSKLIENPSFPSIRLSKLTNLELSLPNVSDATRQVETLEFIEGEMVKANTQIEKLDQLVKSRFVEVFGDPVEGTKWEFGSLSDLYVVKSSKRIYARDQTKSGVPFLRLADIGSLIDVGCHSSSLFISEERYSELKNNGQVPVAGDVLVTARGTLGRCYEIKDSDRFYFQDGMITWLAATDNSPLTSYLLAVFANDHFNDMLNRNCSGTTVKYLSISDLANVRIPLPPLELQQEFADFAAQVDKSRFVAQQQIEKLQMLYDSLAQAYFGD